ncbi:unnamed protein product [Aphanomyces euteiches]
MDVGASVWVMVADVWQRATVVRTSVTSVQCTIQGEKDGNARIVDIPLPHVELCNPDDASSDSMDDLTSLVHLHEPAILHALETRFARGQAYTRTGAILIAVNPFCKLPLYTNTVQQAYMNQGMLENHGDKTQQQEQSLPPHVYQVGDTAYRSMLVNQDAHNILVSGESGAGKTETTKILLTYVAALSSSAAQTGGIRQRVLDSNPVLEAFGNAQTTRNTNSSRFGKFIRLGFDASGGLIGASISTYLLERVRLVSQMAGERNFHIFYELMAGVSLADRMKWQLDAPLESFHYLNQSGCLTRLDGQDDAKLFATTQAAMTTIGLLPSEQTWVFQLLAAILHLGNVKFAKKGHDGSRIADTSTIKAKFVCDLLGVADTAAFEKALCTREIIAGFEPVTMAVTVDRAMDTRDTLAKTIYARIFDYLVDRINGAMVTSVPALQLGVVDIFGFEILATNSLEQLCINFANEKLQQLFARFVFEMEQREYQDEAIPWTFVDYPTNEACISLFESRPCGLWNLLDEQARLPKGSDRTLATKFYDAFLSHDRFNASKLDQAHGAFTITHYAGPVTYKTQGFCAKNKDPVPHEALSALTFSSHDFVADLFEDWHPHDQALPPPAASSTAISARNSYTGGRFPGPSPRNSSNRSSLTGGRPSLQRSSLSSASVLSSTVCLTFKMQLSSLLATLETSTPHFIRCIKPNDTMVPSVFNPIRVRDQLRCGGLVEITRIARLGYPVRMLHDFFLRTFGALGPSEAADTRELVKALALPGLLLGVTKVFMTQEAHESLQALLSKRLVAAATLLQSYVRLHVARTAFVAQRCAAIYIQALVRRRQAVANYKTIRHATILLQAMVRRRQSEVSYQKARHKIILVQSIARRWLAGRLCRLRLRAIVRIQRAWAAIYRARVAQLALACAQHEASTRIQHAFRKKLKEWAVQRDNASFMTDEPETEIHSDHNQEDDDDILDEKVLSPLLKNYTLEWTDGVLGLSFDVSFSSPVVRRVHTSLSACDDIARVQKGDRLIALGSETIRPHDNFRELLLNMAPPVVLTFAPAGGSIPKFSTEMVTLGLAKRPRSMSDVAPDEFDVIVEDASFSWSPYKTHSAMVPMVHGFAGDATTNPGLEKLQASDVLVQVGAVSTASMSYKDALMRLKDAERPLVLRFQVGARRPNSWADHVVVTWSKGSLGVEWKWDTVFHQGLEIQRIHPNGLIAEQNGLQVGDILLEINHQDTRALGFDATQKMLTEHQPTPIQLTFRHMPAWKHQAKVALRVASKMLVRTQESWDDHGDTIQRVVLGILLYCLIFWLDEILFFPLRFI